MSKMKARNELEQLKQEDPLPLRRAKTTQEASIRLNAKAQKKAQDSEAEAKVAAESAGNELGIFVLWFCGFSPATQSRSAG